MNYYLGIIETKNITGKHWFYGEHIIKSGSQVIRLVRADTEYDAREALHKQATKEGYSDFEIKIIPTIK